MGGAIVTNRIRRHAVLQDHGARLDPIVPGVSDRGGCNNTICPKRTASKNCSAEVTSGYLVGVEKVDVFALAREDPEAFSKPYDPETGTLHMRFGVDAHDVRSGNDGSGGDGVEREDRS